MQGVSKIGAHQPHRSSTAAKGGVLPCSSGSPNHDVIDASLTGLHRISRARRGCRYTTMPVLPSVWRAFLNSGSGEGQMHAIGFDPHGKARIGSLHQHGCPGRLQTQERGRAPRPAAAFPPLPAAAGCRRPVSLQRRDQRCAHRRGHVDRRRDKVERRGHGGLQRGDVRFMPPAPGKSKPQSAFEDKAHHAFFPPVSRRSCSASSCPASCRSSFSGIATWRRRWLHRPFLLEYGMTSWAGSWLVAFPVVLVVRALVRRLVAALVEAACRALIHPCRPAADQ